ncbi:hypothetical protein DFA_11340 [Cavenderia fasciculata]|uniref:RNase III domain-containing protein n=1 Tax=Cavenderia fasciculata TaxID=261658 RepID=F4QCE4_CACFS|nr:uncharacterized protein DFA_11340 [Cavenderia fasciculata]EGG13579.1 hypothetical protein DFA_11340 [Cavenderia fasciculata]|eukprot:XP_004350283.1 hypothetical protein DFA_11340 [Cavenderia fasciculata]
MSCKHEFERGEFFGDTYLNLLFTQILDIAIPKKCFTPGLGTFIINCGANNALLAKLFDTINVVGLMDPREVNNNGGTKYKADIVESIISQLYESRHTNQSSMRVLSSIVFTLFQCSCYVLDIQVEITAQVIASITNQGHQRDYSNPLPPPPPPPTLSSSSSLVVVDTSIDIYPPPPPPPTKTDSHSVAISIPIKPSPLPVAKVPVCSPRILCF